MREQVVEARQSCDCLDARLSGIYAKARNRQACGVVYESTLFDIRKQMIMPEKVGSYDRLSDVGNNKTPTKFSTEPKIKVSWQHTVCKDGTVICCRQVKVRPPAVLAE